MNTSTATILAGIVIGSLAYHLNVDNESIFGFDSALVSWSAMSIGAFLGAFLIRISTKEKPTKIALLVVAGILLAVILRMIYDTTFTERSHSLAGIEIFIYSVLTLPTAFAGAFLGHLMKRTHENNALS
jgi:RsiW-degrading membrane proteinase PrsW (M82 family)